MELTLDMNRQYTYADYLQWLDDKRRELINGFIRIMSSPATTHARVTIDLSTTLYNFIKRHSGKCKVFAAPFDVRLPKNGEKDDNKIFSVVQPDIVVVCDPSKIDEKGCLGAPDMVVEVLSPDTRKYDLNDKFNLYEASGVKEYWTVEPFEKDVIVIVFLLQEDGRYAEGVIYRSGTKIPVQTLPGLEVDTDELVAL
ncbi:MAG: Uma2 family endonuclease [Prevotellaceae bacterium]|jgi:Uma2 family endonuclease|nr:Uma2 family endonuclease [Prevotellaceae bacterium]